MAAKTTSNSSGGLQRPHLRVDKQGSSRPHASSAFVHFTIRVKHHATAKLGDGKKHRPPTTCCGAKTDTVTAAAARPTITTPQRTHHHRENPFLVFCTADAHLRPSASDGIAKDMPKSMMKAFSLGQSIRAFSSDISAWLTPLEWIYCQDGIRKKGAFVLFWSTGERVGALGESGGDVSSGAVARVGVTTTYKFRHFFSARPAPLERVHYQLCTV